MQAKRLGVGRRLPFADRNTSLGAIHRDLGFSLRRPRNSARTFLLAVGAMALGARGGRCCRDHRNVCLDNSRFGSLVIYCFVFFLPPMAMRIGEFQRAMSRRTLENPCVPNALLATLGIILAIALGLAPLGFLVLFVLFLIGLDRYEIQQDVAILGLLIDSNKMSSPAARSSVDCQAGATCRPAGSTWVSRTKQFHPARKLLDGRTGKLKPAIVYCCRSRRARRQNTTSARNDNGHDPLS